MTDLELDEFSSKAMELIRQIRILLKDENAGACVPALLNEVFYNIFVVLEGESQELVDSFMESFRKDFDQCEEKLKKMLNIA